MTTEVTESKPKLTVRETAQILLDQGIRIMQCFEPGETKSHPFFPIIYFCGDDDEGHRAVQILWERGIRVPKLIREWQNGDPNGVGGYYDQVIWAVVLFPLSIRPSKPNIEADATPPHNTEVSGLEDL